MTSAPEALVTLREEAAACRRCGLWANATQTVFGEGPTDGGVIFVGEQPGDREDLAGQPFVGPAGAVFDRALAAAGIDRAAVYVTNAVKHFKNEPLGKRRLHKKPNAAEIEQCRWWLVKETALLAPRLTVALGATALRSLLERDETLSRLRGTILASPFAGPVFVTIHPSLLLRLPDPVRRRREFEAFVHDLRFAALSPAARQRDAAKRREDDDDGTSRGAVAAAQADRNGALRAAGRSPGQARLR
jgi:uracil-DNA glycosylase